MYYKSCVADSPDNTLRLLKNEGEASDDAFDSSGVVASGESEETLLKSGKISLDEYIEMSVDRALAHLQGQISADRLSTMRDILKRELEEDPNLSALVAQVAAGQ